MALDVVDLRLGLQAPLVTHCSPARARELFDRYVDEVLDHGGSVRVLRDGEEIMCFGFQVIDYGLDCL
jgi:hypothetical protein